MAARPRCSEAHRAPPLAVTLSQPWSSSLSVPRVGPDLVGGRCPHPHFLLITVTSSWALQLLPPPGSGFQETATPGSRLHRCTGRSQMRRQQADVQAEAAMLLASVRVCPVPDAPLELGRGLPRTRLADPRLWWSATRCVYTRVPTCPGVRVGRGSCQGLSRAATARWAPVFPPPAFLPSVAPSSPTPAVLSHLRSGCL